MRNLNHLLCIGPFLLLTRTASAQELGVRWGDVLGNDIALDMRLKNLHADISFGDNVGVELLWDYYKPLKNEALRFYIGAGVSALFGDPFWLGISGEAGLEYRFSGVPISLSADWRPTFWIIDETDFRAEGFGVNARWIFGQR